MSQSSDVEALLLRFMEAEGERRVLTSHGHGAPALMPLTTMTSATSSCGAVPCVEPSARPTQAAACASSAVTSGGCKTERPSTASSGSSPSSSSSSSSSSTDTRAEAATPSRRPSRHTTQPVHASDAVQEDTGAPHASSQGDPAPRAGSASPPPSSTPPLSLSDPVVEFLAGVQLQGYAARLLHELRIRTMAELAARGASSEHVAELLGPSASLQQQGELWRGLRRWERDEARLAKAAAAEARRRAQEMERDARRQAKGLRTAAATTAAVKRKRHAALASSSDQASSETPSGVNAGSGGRQSRLLFATLGNYVGTHDGASFRVADMCDQPCPPHLVSSGDSSVAAATSSFSVGAASSSVSCPSLTVSATQLMRQLSYRCTHSRQAIRQRHDRDHGGGVGAAVAASATSAPAAPYDVDAEEVEVESSGDGVAAEEDGTGLYTSNNCGGGGEDSRGVDAHARAAVDSSSDAESLPNCAQQESNRCMSSLPPQRPEVLSPSCATSASQLSSILCSLRDPDAPIAAREGLTNASTAPEAYAMDEFRDPTCSHAATGVVRNGLVAMQNISLSALSAAAEWHPLPPWRAVACVRDEDEAPQEGPEAITHVSDTAEETIEEVRSALEVGGFADSEVEHLVDDAASIAKSTPQRLSGPAPWSITEATAIAPGVGAVAAAELTAQKEQRHTAAQRRLQEALETALRTYNREVEEDSLSVTAALRHDEVPLRVVVHPLSARCELHAAPLVCWATGPAADDFPERRDVGTLCDIACDRGALPLPDRADCGPVEASVEVLDIRGRALRESGEVVLSALTSTDVSARTTGRATAAPAPASFDTRATLPPLPMSTSQTTTAITTTRIASPTSPLPASVLHAEAKSDAGGDESVGRLTVGTQRLPASPLERYSTEAGGTASGVGAAGSVPSSLLWVVHEEAGGEEDGGEAAGSAAASRSPAPPSAAASLPLHPVPPDNHDSNKQGADVDAEERWWAAYGIDALEYTQNGDFMADTRARSASPGVGAVAGAGDAEAAFHWLRQPATSPPPRVVVELSSSSAEEDEEDEGEEECASELEKTALTADGAARSEEQSRSSPAPVNSSAFGGDKEETVPAQGCDVHLDPAAWPRMSNAELRQLCEEVGLRTVSSAGLASSASVAEPRRGQSAPLPALTSRCATRSLPRSASPEWDAFGLPLHTSRELFHISTTGAHDSAMTAPHPSTQPEQMAESGEKVLEGEVVPAQPQQHHHGPLPTSAAAALERESMLEALRLLAVRLKFRSAVAPLFLHRVSRLSGLPYKRVRAADLLDEGSLLTRDDLQQARQRVKAEEQAEADRCIAAALAAQAAESVEHDVQLVASRWAGSTAASAPSIPAREELCAYELILLREPVLVEAAVAAVQSAFPHISHTRVQQLLTANEVTAEVAGTTNTKASTTPSRSPQQPPLPSSPPAPTAASPHERPSAAPSAVGAPAEDGGATPLSQEARQRANARRYFSQRGYTTRRGMGWGRGRGRVR